MSASAHQATSASPSAPSPSTFTYHNGGVYEGDFKAGNRHSHGKFTTADGSVVFDGEWADAPVR